MKRSFGDRHIALQDLFPKVEDLQRWPLTSSSGGEGFLLGSAESLICDP